MIFFGSAALWTLVYPGWHVHSGGKLPFFREGYDRMNGGRPRLTFAARRLDGEEALVWSDLAGGGFTEGKGLAGMFMVTGIDIPSSGCWEINAHYGSPDGEKPGNVQTLTYTVWVEP